MSFIKDPNDVLDYMIDWTDWLGADTILNSTWYLEGDVVIDSDSNDNKTSTAWISGGTHKKDSRVSNRIVTQAGRTKQASFVIQVRNQ